MEEIDIWWEGPFNQNDILENKIKEDESENLRKDIGLYQVYSSHPLYGNDVLVYIGLTTDSFKKRLKNRWVIENGNDSNNVKIYLGCIFSPSKELNSKIQTDKIKKAETLLINALKPAFNSSNIQSVPESFISADYIVNNLNNYRNLYPQLSSKYFWNNQFINFEITDLLASENKCKISEENEFYGFEIKGNDNICVGVDYNYWNKENIPLVIGIHKESNVSKNELQSKFDNIGEDKEYYFISASDDLLKEDVIKEINQKLEIVLEICNKK